ncbi:Na+/H+ antiporter NhaC family protein [Psychrosphaera sp. F3M07]|uniref:Na+/H+ antiporter NhaC family protein n=1 Tax=Psychrosphaera sp. F3M07 TaxID=2841560 RepID=UPI001C09F4EC|nr:Na+/H+ antiporter NhaC family protein [Psychrosphaera sp. F3M07]
MSESTNGFDELTHPNSSGLAILPLLLFVLIFLGTGVWLHIQGVEFAFYQLPAPVAIIPAIILALCLDKYLASRPIKLENSLTTLIEGMGNDKVITMCLIYLLAGAFSSVAQATGGVDVMVNLGLQFIPAPLVIAGLFLISALIATAMGTSMGTIGAIAPIAVGIVGNVSIDPAIIAGAVVGGAIFGDNLSLISDTTIASTKTQGAELKDKFYENLIFAIPAALICIALYAFIGFNNPAEISSLEVSNIWLGLPYLLVIILAVMGVNVFLVLLLGTVLSALTGSLLGDYQLSLVGKDIFTGFSNMQEIFLLSMLIGGLSELMKRQGGLGYLVGKINQLVHVFSKKSSSSTNQVAIASLAFTTNLAVANNTVAIIVTGDTAKQLAQEGNIEPKRSASLLDVFSCIAQGLVPYGAQALLAAATFGISPLDVVANVWYCMILAVVSIVVVKLRKS